MNPEVEKQTTISIPCTRAERHEFYVHATRKEGRLFTAWCLEALREKANKEKEGPPLP